MLATLQIGAMRITLALNTLKLVLRQAGLDLFTVRRRYDDIPWPHATKGFLKMKQKIPGILAQMDLADEDAARAADWQERK
ncbi:MAG: hypothetical protein HKP40_03515 [Litoreibacter sp.]|nr:hypothetical protein [Litoreibacter sp.]